MKAGSRARDEQLIDERLSLKTKAAREYETTKDIYGAYLGV